MKTLTADKDKTLVLLHMWVCDMHILSESKSEYVGICVEMCVLA